MNPYDYGRPVMDHTCFAGRLELLKEIDYTLALATSERPLYRNLAITGLRGVGKTSLLNQIAYLAEINGLLAARVELNNELAASQAALFHQILDDIASTLREFQAFGGLRSRLRRLVGGTSVELELNVLIGQLKAARKDSSDVPQEALRKSLRDAVAEARRVGRKAILLCIDEADLLAKDETVLQALRNTFQRQDGYLVVLAGREDLLTNLGKVFGPMERFFNQMTLGPFDNDAEVRECLEAPLLDEEKKVVTREFAQEVMGLTGGQPYLVKLMAFYAYRAMQEQGWRRLQLSEAVVNATISGARTYQSSEELTERLSRRLAEPFEVDRPLTQSVTVVHDGDEDFDTLLESEIEDSLADSEIAPVIKLVNRAFVDAVSRQATELIFTPESNRVVIRVRTDGAMRDLVVPPKSLHSAIVARLKIMAYLDISERRLPQDGRMRLRIGGKEFDASVQTAPTLHGESVTIHLQAAVRGGRDVETLGFPADDLANVIAGLQHVGLTLVCGEASAGKTTTLYSLLPRAITPERYAVTAEESIGVPISGATQHQIRDRIGLTMAALLRSVLRQKPDVVMIDAIRDADTAKLAVDAASAGRVVLAGILGDDASAGLGAMLDYDVDRALLASSLQFVVGQRLLRRTCVNCKSAGCSVCDQTGYKGRFAVFQVLTIDDAMRLAIREGRALPDLQHIAAQNGLRLLRDLALDRAHEGATTTEEVARVFDRTSHS